MKICRFCRQIAGNFEIAILIAGKNFPGKKPMSSHYTRCNKEPLLFVTYYCRLKPYQGQRLYEVLKKHKIKLTVLNLQFS